MRKSREKSSQNTSVEVKISTERVFIQAFQTQRSLSGGPPPPSFMVSTPCPRAPCVHTFNTTHIICLFMFMYLQTPVSYYRIGGFFTMTTAVCIHATTTHSVEPLCTNIQLSRVKEEAGILSSDAKFLSVLCD